MRHTIKQCVLALAASVVLIRPAATQTNVVGGEAYGTFVNVAGASTKSGTAVLPDTGGMAAADVDNHAVPGTVTVDMLTSMTTGAVDTKRSSAQSTSHLENVNILNGLITARTVIAVASSAVGWSGASSNALGSGFADLVVNGTPVGAADDTPAPNTRMALPGIGYVVLNEQATNGSGVSSTGLSVNMIHVVLQDVLTGATTGEIIVGSATSAAGS